MATTFISYNDKGYWIPDGIVATIAKYILEVSPTIEKPDWFMEYEKLLYEAAMDCKPGWNALMFDEYLKSSQQIEYTVLLLRKVISFLRGKGEYISAVELNEISKKYNDKSDGRWLSNIKTQSLIKILKIIIDVLLGKRGLGPSNRYTLRLEF